MNPNAAKKSVVTATEINEYLALKETISALKRRIEILTDSVNQSEETILSKLDFGADPSASGFLLSVRQTEKRFPAWKEHYIESCGKDAADQILKTTQAKIYRDLVIKKAA